MVSAGAWYRHPLGSVSGLLDARVDAPDQPPL